MVANKNRTLYLTGRRSVDPLPPMMMGRLPHSRDSLTSTSYSLLNFFERSLVKQQFVWDRLGAHPRLWNPSRSTSLR